MQGEELSFVKIRLFEDDFGIKSSRTREVRHGWGMEGVELEKYEADLKIDAMREIVQREDFKRLLNDDGLCLMKMISEEKI